MTKTTEVKIEKIVTGGKGIGYSGGKIVFADRCAVGDLVTVKINAEKKKLIIGEVVVVNEPSPDRIPPECVYFGDCGGCDFWHVDYATEIRYKKGAFIETVNKIGHLGLEDVNLHECAPFKNYRNRVQFKVRNNNGRIDLGFYRKGTNRIVDIEKCMITSVKINEQIDATKRFLNGMQFNSSIPQIDFSIDDADNDIIMIIHVISDDLNGVRSAVAGSFKEFFPDCVKPFLQMGRKDTLTPVFEEDRESQIFYTVREPRRPELVSGANRSRNEFGTTDKSSTGINRNLTCTLSLSPGSFKQVNYAQNQKIVDKLLEYLDLSSDDTLLDLFCGIGNFSFPASFYCKEITGIESYPQAVKDAINNKKRLNINNIEFICADVESEIEKIAKSGQKFHSIIIDPPRTGAIASIENIAKIADNSIIYISCDTATFARDAAVLISAGFMLEDISIVDMFPRTHHVETVAKFKKKKTLAPSNP